MGLNGALEDMKVFVQQVSTKRFLADGRGWSDAIEAAQPFSTAAEAIEFCVEHDVKDVQLVKISDTGELYGYLQPFGSKDPGLQSSNLDEARKRSRQKRRERPDRRTRTST